MDYKKEELVKISWAELDNFVLKIKKDIDRYLNKNNLKIDVIVPIFRGGGIPALRLAFHYNILRILPYQYKYIHKGKITKKEKLLDSDFSQLIDFKKENPIILVVEGNHSTGKIANSVIAEIKSKLR